MNFEEMGNLYLLRDLEINRKASLARVRSSIVEMQVLLQQMPLGATNRYLAECLLRTLRKNEDQLKQRVFPCVAEEGFPPGKPGLSKGLGGVPDSPGGN
jgi:hypothetical protein